MAAYWIARSHVTDAVVYKKYTDQVPAIVSKHGGRILARGGRYQIMAGPQTFERYCCDRVPDARAGRRVLSVPQYQQASVHRIAGGVVETVVVEGV